MDHYHFEYDSGQLDELMKHERIEYVHMLFEHLGDCALVRAQRQENQERE